MISSTDECAHEVLDVIPAVMRVIRAEMRRHRSSDLSVPQFRALTFINNNPGTSLLTVAEHLGLTSPSACRMIDVLVGRGLVFRQTSPKDRRMVNISLTEMGQSMLEIARKGTMENLATIFTSLTQNEQSTIMDAMKIMRPLFASNKNPEIIQSGGNL
ncbi:MAG: MarR family transcriptional regulator [Anaerolineaceae bacterium]|nr:MarR family transcriptional regulator [Anaerolineaceae bacterium]